MRRGRLFILSGPSGVGKGTLRERALKDVEGLIYSISCTTRSPRPGERDGVEYRFVSEADFKSIWKILYTLHIDCLLVNAMREVLKNTI